MMINNPSSSPRDSDVSESAEDEMSDAYCSSDEDEQEDPKDYHKGVCGSSEKRVCGSAFSHTSVFISGTFLPSLKVAIIQWR